MTDKQRASFFGTWWPKCCEVNGWDEKSEKLRREIVLKATTELKCKVPKMPAPTERLSRCNQDQLTAVFKYVWFLTDSTNLQAAIPVANPELEAEADEQRRAVFALSNKGVTEPEIARIAAPLCRRHHVGDWQRLPSKVLKEMMHWKQFQPDEIKRRRSVAALPLEQALDKPIIYHLRPSPKTPRPVCAGPY